VPGRRSARRDVAIADQRGREFKRSLPVPAWRSCEPAASSMPGWNGRDDVRREKPARPVERLRKAYDRHRRRPRVHRRDDAAAPLRRRFEDQRHTQSCRRRVRLRRHRRRRVAGVRHHQNDRGDPAEPPDKNAEDHHSDARQRSFAHGAFVRLREYSVKRATESAMTESEQTYGSDPRTWLQVDLGTRAGDDRPSCSRSAHDRATPTGTGRHQTTREDTWNRIPCLAAPTLGSGARKGVGVQIPHLAPL
jgi:hypothetical protein